MTKKRLKEKKGKGKCKDGEHKWKTVRAYSSTEDSPISVGYDEPIPIWVIEQKCIKCGKKRSNTRPNS